MCLNYELVYRCVNAVAVVITMSTILIFVELDVRPPTPLRFVWLRLSENSAVSDA